MIGSLNGRTWIHWDMLWPWALVALPLGLVCAGMANVLHLGDEWPRGWACAWSAPAPCCCSWPCC